MNQISTATAKKLELMWNSRRLHDNIVKFIFDQDHSQNVVAKSMATKFRIPLGCATQLVDYVVESEHFRMDNEYMQRACIQFETQMSKQISKLGRQS